MGRRGQQQNTERRINAILVLLAGWMGACLVSAWAWFVREPQLPGLSNGQTALGWQGVAGMLGFAVWAIGLGLPKDNGIRKMSPVALILTLLVVVLAGAGAF